MKRSGKDNFNIYKKSPILCNIRNPKGEKNQLFPQGTYAPKILRKDSDPC